ncbi:MAG: hypothetical protein SH847_03885 [Roseiflexaceae bacterium]|nr:hypothetical protein [Roseiflexaceae bacterium]
MSRERIARVLPKPQLQSDQTTPHPDVEQRFGTLDMQALQRTVGNQQAQRTLRRMHSTTIQRVSTPPTQADQEAEAAQTQTLLQAAHREMLSHSDQTVRNTAKLFQSNGTVPQRMAYSPMTLRSDSAALVAAGTLSAASAAFFFYGNTQNNQHQFGPFTGGTIDRTGALETILVRGRLADGTWQTHEQIIGTFVHEASHLLVASYGQHPGTTTDASSFDRYKDEFRSYWVEPYGHAWNNEKDGDKKARAIRTFMIANYPDLQTPYNNNAAFKAQVDTHMRPDGYNLSNNPNLDLLFTLIGGGVAGIDLALSHIVTQMNPTERAEANNSPLINQQITKYKDADAEARVHNALRFPQTNELAHELNPANSPRMSALLEAIALRDVMRIQESFVALTSAERGELVMNEAVMLFVTRQIPDKRLRACMYAMLTTGNLRQFVAMDNFINACIDAWVVLNGGDEQPPTTTPDFLRTALKAVAYEARLSLYKLVEDARQQYVDALPAPINQRVLEALREGNEPR